jgi:hypothetical protein
VAGVILGKLTYANVVATLALFAAVGGGAMAAIKLSPDSVKSKNIVDGKVKARDLGGGAAAANLDPNSIDGDSIDEATLKGVDAASLAGKGPGSFVASADPRVAAPEPWHNVAPQGEGGTALTCHLFAGTDCLSNYVTDNGSGDFNPVGFYRDREVVHLRGVASRVCHTVGESNGCEADGRQIFTLPAGYRPVNSERQVIPTGFGASPETRTLRIGSGGTVSLETPVDGLTPVWLDGVTFRTG